MEEDEDVDGGMGEGRTTMTRKMVAAEGGGKTPTGRNGRIREGRTMKRAEPED